MPEPLRPSQRYMPGLDGLRALAVLAVIAYHLEFGWAQGGLLGVGIFFTLSGYLITDMLLAQIDRGGERIAAFWLGRARRLLPALFLMLAVVVTWVTVIGPAQPPQFRQAVGAAALYVSNWQLILQHVSYFARFGPASPLNHLWSLGVEEQFYILWPLLLPLGVRLIRERPTAAGLRPRLALATLILAAASAVEMGLLYRPSFDPSRVYFGTDTRAFEILAGAALAMVWPSARLRAEISRGARRTLDGLGAIGLLAICVMIVRTSEYSTFLYRGGFVLLALATVLLLTALVHPAARLGAVLGVAPLRWIGVRSYGIYLWSVPIIVLTTPASSHGVDLLRNALQVSAIVGVAALSWRFVEQPIRHGALARLWRRLRSDGWRVHALPRAGWAVLAGALGLLALTCVGLAGASIGSGREAGAAPGALTASVPMSTVTKSFDAGVAAATDEHSQRTSCRAVIHIGDSTSEGLISSDYLPDPAQRIEAQYARVGATLQHYEISGARSIVERYEGKPNAYEVAKRWKLSGYHGCWVLALGTNDTADVYVGSNVGRLARVRQMMSVIGDQPVMWVDVRSLLASGPYSEHNMRLWNQALLQACSKYPNMRVFDWAAVAHDGWFIDDGIHYNTPGYAARSRLIAQALARAFPGQGHSPGCVVD
ncbi:MAG TPA: acyltransferase family protein [Solirubrobacteraceae bacterium]|nr:acyltransferase family protein [Solirubrobacteraceae bacterium]